MDDAERRVLDAIDPEWTLARLRELVAIRSLGGRERPAQEWVASQLQRLGFAVDVWDLDLASLRAHPSFSMEVERAEGLGVVGSLEAGDGRTLILNGHVDVVPAGDTSSWTHPPWEATLRDGRVYGRGTADMKGGLVCALAAAKALIDAGASPRGRLLVESVIGEEDGGVGTLAACLRGHRADGAIVLEPTRLRVAPAQAGALCFRITIRGRAAHASVREEGVSAIEKFLPILEALVALERERNARAADPLYARYRTPYALSVGRLDAGDWPSTVPERLTFEGRYGVAVGEDVGEARRAFERRLEAAAQRDPWLRDHPPTLEWWGGQFAPASVPPDHPIVRTVSGAHADATGEAATLEGMTYGSDMRLLVHVGETPTVLYGPGDVRDAHRPDEFVRIDELHAATRTIALAAVRFCGGA
ncbi:MAG: ArgE/DapE family deacylase [Methanobacteriota archaeon]